MDESSQTNARVSAELQILHARTSSQKQKEQNELHILQVLAGYNDKQGSPAADEGSAPESITNKSKEIIEVTEDSFENDAPPELDDSDDDSAVEIVDAAAFREQQQQAAAAAAATSNSNGGEDSDEELQCVGTANETKLPHNRQDCLTFRYNNNNSSSTSNGTSCCAETTLENAKFCQLCYCYVCDKPASECTSWYLGERGAVHEDGNGGPPEDTKQSSSKTDDTEEDTSLQQYNNHCNASDKGSAKNLWKNMRTAIKNGRDPSVVTANAAASNPDESLAQYLARYTVPAATSTAESAAAALAEQLRQRQRERHRYRAHATGRGGAHQRRTAARDGGEENYSSIYGSVSMDAANAMDFSSTTTTTTSSRRSRAPRQERRTRPAGSNNEQRSRHSNHRDRMRTQAILEDLYS